MDEWLWLVVILGLAVPMYTSWEAIGFVDRGVQEEQGQFEHGQDYDPRRVRLAIVHARQDIVGLYFLLGRVVGMLGLLTALVAAHVIHHW